jgi:hypothetical protein
VASRTSRGRVRCGVVTEGVHERLFDPQSHLIKSFVAEALSRSRIERPHFFEAFPKRG